MSSSKAAKAFHVFWEIINRERVVWPQKKELLSRARRVAALKRAGYNLFRLPSRAVFIDLLTDSGTARMSEAQWLSMFRGDESYAGSESWFRLRKKIQEVFTFSYVLPVHQGRAAERVFFEATLTPQKNIIVGNTPFDTTRYWIETCGGKVVDCLCAANYDDPEQAPFFGNVDLQKLESALKAHRGAVACMLITITCNSAGGQPVSFENIRAARKLAKRYGIPLFLDAARYAENAYFNKRHHGNAFHTIRDTVRKTMALADGILVSAKKDCLVNIGGFIALNDAKLYGHLKPYVTAQEGYADGYGGMAGYTMETMTLGIEESLDETYLKERIGLHGRLRDGLVNKLNIPALPVAGHGIFVDAGAFLPHMPWDRFPGYALALALYVEGGIRAVEVGSLMLGRDPKTGKNRRARRELTRLAFPRRVYGQAECEHIFKTFREIVKQKNRLQGVTFAPGGEIKGMRHFDSEFKLL